MTSDLIVRPMTPDFFPRTSAILTAGVSEGVAPGMVAGVWTARDPDSVRLTAVGQRRKVPSEEPMQTDTVFDLASLTKILVTASLTALLVDRKWLAWDTPLRSIFPEFVSPEVRIQHLLSHTAGFVAWQPFWESLRAKFSPRPLTEISIAQRQAAMRELVFAVVPDARPGERVVYSDISFLLLGFALEEVTGMPLDRAVREFLWRPMGLETLAFYRVDRPVSAGLIDSVAATEQCSWRGGVLQGQVHDDNCWAMGGYAGHAGAFGAARDVLLFTRRLQEGFLSRETLKAIWTRSCTPVDCSRTLGWDTPSGPEPSSGRYFSPVSVGHLGFTGTSLWMDLEKGLAVTLLTNRVHPSRENTLIRAFRPRFHDAIREDLGF